jgi:hypothetical protein
LSDLAFRIAFLKTKEKQQNTDDRRFNLISVRAAGVSNGCHELGKIDIQIGTLCFISIDADKNDLQPIICRYYVLNNFIQYSWNCQCRRSIQSTEEI